MAQAKTDKAGMQDIKENWPIILAAALCLFFMFGVPTYMFPWIYGEVVREFGWTRAQATDIISVKFLTGALTAILIGYSVDRFGPRRITIIACIIGGLAMLAFMGLTKEDTGIVSTRTLYLMLGSCLGLSALGVMISTKALLGRLFEENMGVALGLALIGTSAAGAAIPFLYGALKDAFGWREGVAILSCGIWFLALPLYLFAVRESKIPASRGMARGSEKMPPDAVAMSDFLKGKNFWFIVIGLPLVSMVDMGMSQHLVLYMNGDLGIDKTLVRTGLTFMAIVTAFSKVLFGRLYDKTSSKGIAFTYIWLAFAVLLLFPIEGIMTMLICLAVKGSAHGGLVVDVPVVTKHCYGPWGIGKKIAVFTMIYGFGMSGGPRLMSMIHDTYGSYHYGFFTLMTTATIAAILMLQVKPHYWLKNKKAEEEEGVAATEPSEA